MKSFILLVSLFLLGCTKNEKSSIYLLPKGYTGYVIILYNQKDGIPQNFFNGKRVYEIPKSGILKTQFSADYGRSEFPEFYYESISDKNKIPIMINWNDSNENRINVTLPTSGKAYKKLDGSEAIEYSTIVIGTKEQIINYTNELSKIDKTKLE